MSSLEIIPWREMGPVSGPFLDPVIGPERFELAYTHLQRNWWLRVYNNTCHFPVVTGQGVDICGKKHDKAEVHHITPAAYILEQTPWLDPNDLRSTLGIYIGKVHHDHDIHADIGAVHDRYWQVPPEERKDLFKNAISEHHKLARQGIIFWNPNYDALMRLIAQEKVADYMRNNPMDAYPADKQWASRPHPAKRKWRGV